MADCNPHNITAGGMIGGAMIGGAMMAGAGHAAVGIAEAIAEAREIRAYNARVRERAERELRIDRLGEKLTALIAMYRYRRGPRRR